MYYDKNGQFKVAGAEAEGAAVTDLAEDEGWLKAELYVRADHRLSRHNNHNLLPLSHPLSPHHLATQLTNQHAASNYACAPNP